MSKHRFFMAQEVPPMEYKVLSLPAQKRIALIAHDNMKAELTDWVQAHVEQLKYHQLFATGTTGHALEKQLGVPVHKFISGPLGGDQQVGAHIAEGKIDILFFFWDPFEPMPHDPDVKALLRLAAAWNIPVACNPASADFIISSALMHSEHPRSVPDYDKYLSQRIRKFG
jgi:methylglyoxal synthase